MIDLEKLSPILEEYKTYSLLASGYTYPRGMNTNFAKADDEAIRAMSRDLAARIDEMHFRRNRKN